MCLYIKQVKRALLLTFICLFALPLVCSAHKSNAHSSQSSVAAKATVVGIATVVKQDIAQTIPALGTMSAINTVTLSSTTDGTVASILFKNGQSVAKGMPVIQLDATQAWVDYQKAKTALDLAKTKYSASLKLKNLAVSIEKLNELDADVKTKKAEADSAFSLWQQKKIIAPLSGVLGAFAIHKGDYVKAGDPLVTLVNTSTLRVDYSIPEAYLPKLKLGQDANIFVSAYPKKKFVGTVSFISPSVNQSTRSVAVQATVPNPKGLLSPGMFVKLSQHVDTLKNILAVPDQAVSADVKGYFVYKMVNNKVAQVYIKVGQRQSGMAQILSGLKFGDTVVVTGQQKLRDGSLVEVAKSK